MAVQLVKEVMPRVDASFVSDNKYALGIMQFQTRAVTNHGHTGGTAVELGCEGVLPNRNRHGSAHTGVAGNDFADVGAELGPAAALHKFVLALEGPFVKDEGSSILPLRCSVVDGSASQARPADGSSWSSAVGRLCAGAQRWLGHGSHSFSCDR